MKYENVTLSSMVTIIVICVCVGVIATVAPKTPDPALAPTEASKQLFSNEAYNVYEFTDPVTYKRYLVFRGMYSISVVEAPRPVTALEKK